MKRKKIPKNSIGIFWGLGFASYVFWLYINSRRSDRDSWKCSSFGLRIHFNRNSTCEEYFYHQISKIQNVQQSTEWISLENAAKIMILIEIHKKCVVPVEMLLWFSLSVSSTFSTQWMNLNGKCVGGYLCLNNSSGYYTTSPNWTNSNTLHVVIHITVQLYSSPNCNELKNVSLVEKPVPAIGQSYFPK